MKYFIMNNLFNVNALNWCLFGFSQPQLTGGTQLLCSVQKHPTQAEWALAFDGEPLYINPTLDINAVVDFFTGWATVSELETLGTGLANALGTSIDIIPLIPASLGTWLDELPNDWNGV
jgi:hypothetical protein